MRKTLLTFALIGMLLSSFAPAWAALSASTDRSQYYVGDNLTVYASGGTPSGIVLMQISTGASVVWVSQDTFTAGGAKTWTIKIPATMSVGSYTVSVKDDTAGVTTYASFDIITTTPPPVNAAPTASISGPAQSIEGDSASFSGSGSADTDGTIIGYSWTFGDGGNGAGVSTTHTYTVPGTYTVTLVVTDNLGATGTATASITVVANQAPTVSISGSDGKINEAISFSGVAADADGTISSYAWSFGDGGSASGQTASHTYTAVGTYTVTLTVTDNKGKTGTATLSVRVYPPPPTVEDIANDTPADAAAKIEDTLPSDAAVILEELPPESAADIVEELLPETAAAVIVEANVTEAAQIVEKMTTETAVAMVEAAVTAGDTDAMSTVLLEMNDVQAANVLVDVSTTQGAQIVESMAAQDLNEAAKTVEDTIKLFINELDPTTKAEVKKKVKETMENVTVESLVQLFIEIANLPNTPSTVAAMFEAFDLAKTLEIITGVGEQGAWSELGKVFGYMNQATLGTIYSAMPSSQRASISPYLSAQTVTILPKVGTYQVSALAVTPVKAAPGAAVTVSATVRNVGAEAGTHDVVLKVNGAAVQTKTVALNAGESTSVSFALTAGAAGNYAVAVESSSTSFSVQVAAANIAVTGVTLSKTSAASGEQVTATVTLGNTGDISGSYALTVTLDGIQKYSEAVTVDAGQTVTKTYSVSSEVAGAHTVAAGGQSAQFTVSAPPPTWMDYIWWIVGGVVVVLALLYYFLKMKK